jgi:hypothetical protein
MAELGPSKRLRSLIDPKIVQSRLADAERDAESNEWARRYLIDVRALVVIAEAVDRPHLRRVKSWFGRPRA